MKDEKNNIAFSPTARLLETDSTIDKSSIVEVGRFSNDERHFLIMPWYCIMSAALGIARTSSALRSLARHLPTESHFLHYTSNGIDVVAYIVNATFA